jgi:acyl-[acyl carrier protein]--UDP-N-acetylglucosamine O-acyltransferase
LWRQNKRLDVGILQVRQELEMIPELKTLLDFLEGSKRGVIR